MKSTGYKFTVHIAVHNTAIEWIRPSLVTSSLSSSVIACRGGAGSTTAAGKARHRPGEGYQGRQNTLPSQPQRKHHTFLHHIPRTAYVLANHHQNTSNKSLWRPSEAQGQAWRRRTSRSSLEEKDKLKPGAGQEVKDKPQPSQEK
jgi:hypothetical protein